jgi:ketol-acid reductoisomerase
MVAQKIAIIGFGSQGRAWAQRLRHGRSKVVVGLRRNSRARAVARKRGFEVASPAQAVKGCSVVALLVPDQSGRSVFTQLEKHLPPGCLVVFAAGYPMVFPLPLESDHDVVLVAPHGPGRDLEAGLAMSGFVAVGQDGSGRAMRRARAVARALGLRPLFETTPRQEALGDLFGEQALLCGGLVGLTAEVARVMVRGGIPPSHAWLETVGQLQRLSGLLAERGIDGFWREISDCAASGAAAASPRLFGPDFARALAAVWDDIESGRFARRFEARGRPRAYPARWQVVADLERARAGSVAPKKKGGRSGHPSKRRRD